MKVSEIFFSISGEGRNAGIPTVFVRLAGCNLDCTYCDTQYAREGGDELTVDEVVKKVKVVKKVRGFRESGWCLITGGNPLYQVGDVHKLVQELKDAAYLVEIEENGSIDPPVWFGIVDSWVTDVKCPSSGPSYGSFRTGWLKKLRKQDSLKFVVGTQEDLDFVRGFLNNTRLRPTVLVSPVTGILLNKKEGTISEYWNREWLQECTEFCKVQNVRLSLQIHKIIYGDKRGV